MQTRASRLSTVQMRASECRKATSATSSPASGLAALNHRCNRSSQLPGSLLQSWDSKLTQKWAPEICGSKSISTTGLPRTCHLQELIRTSISLSSCRILGAPGTGVTLEVFGLKPIQTETTFPGRETGVGSISSELETLLFS